MLKSPDAFWFPGIFVFMTGHCSWSMAGMVSAYPQTVSLASYHEHYPSLGLDECVRIVHHHGIDLRRSDRLPVLADMQPPAVDDFRNLLRPQPAVTLGQHIKYRFLDFHFT